MLAATMLAVPNENYLFEQLRGFEVDTLLDARDAAIANAAQTHAETWAALVAQHDTGQPYQADAAGMARRALGNTAFSYLAKNQTGAALEEMLQARYAKADNLTTTVARCWRIGCRHTGIERGLPEPGLLEDFYQASGRITPWSSTFGSTCRHKAR